MYQATLPSIAICLNTQEVVVAIVVVVFLVAFAYFLGYSHGKGWNDGPDAEFS